MIGCGKGKGDAAIICVGPDGGCVDGATAGFDGGARGSYKPIKDGDEEGGEEDPRIRVRIMSSRECIMAKKKVVKEVVQVKESEGWMAPKVNNWYSRNPRLRSHYLISYNHHAALPY